MPLSKVVSLPRADDDCPPRTASVGDLTFIVSIFKNDRELLPFVRYLFNEYGIVSVRQYDAARINAFEEFKLEPRLRHRFKSMLGRPHRPKLSKSARVLKFQRAARPD
jgi:hypothetical protein